ncbi:MAG TPA: hypothetical protein VGW35_10885 [Methylomirabilota bacterium]|nr:hypothetical protein [Methylomirabilota bacterium]
MTDMSGMGGGTAAGDRTLCRCGADLTILEASWGCTDCGGDCCPECAFWLESTVYCPGCTDRLLAA